MPSTVAAMTPRFSRSRSERARSASARESSSASAGVGRSPFGYAVAFITDSLILLAAHSALTVIGFCLLRVMVRPVSDGREVREWASA